MDDLAKQVAEDLLVTIERKLMALPDGFRLAVSSPQTVRYPATASYRIEHNIQELEPGAQPAGEGRWTIYGPMTPELRAAAMALGAPRDSTGRTLD